MGQFYINTEINLKEAKQRPRSRAWLPRPHVAPLPVTEPMTRMWVFTALAVFHRLKMNPLFYACCRSKDITGINQWKRTRRIKQLPPCISAANSQG